VYFLLRFGENILGIAMTQDAPTCKRGKTVEIQ
jgi:hypothetical protein